MYHRELSKKIETPYYLFDDLQLPQIDHKNQFIETQYISQWIKNVRLFCILEYIFRHSLKICLKVHDWCCWKCVSYSAGPLCVRLALDMIYEINTKLISKALLSVFCQVFCYFCRNAKKCPLLSFMRILSMEPSDRWNMSFSFFGKPYFCLQHAIIQCYRFTVEIFFKHCEELVFSLAGLTFNCTVMKYLRGLYREWIELFVLGGGGSHKKEDIAPSMTREMYIHIHSRPTSNSRGHQV